MRRTRSYWWILTKTVEYIWYPQCQRVSIFCGLLSAHPPQKSKTSSSPGRLFLIWPRVSWQKGLHKTDIKSLMLRNRPNKLIHTRRRAVVSDMLFWRIQHVGVSRKTKKWPYLGPNIYRLPTLEWIIHCLNSSFTKLAFMRKLLSFTKFAFMRNSHVYIYYCNGDI